MAHIIVIGPGAIGGSVAAALSGPHDLTICANSKFETLVIHAADGGTERHAVRVVTRPEEVTSADWVLVCVKSHQTASVAKWLAASVGRHTKVAILQNGVEHRARVAPFLDSATPVMPIVVQLPAQRVAAGEITLFGGAALEMQDDALGREFAALFAGSRIEMRPTNDILTRMWEKLCFNAPDGALAALTLAPSAPSGDPQLQLLARRIAQECIAVGTAEGAKLPEGLADKVAHIVARKDNNGNSMYFDRRDGRAMEYDARNAVISRLGAKHGIPTPVSDVLVPLLRALSQSHQPKA
ncbi:MAG TPA: 2-dehydropantoate 2-reductase [Rhizomicrobium sp.]